MKNYSIKYSGILLAGGKSSRMGEDKAFMRYGDLCLYEYSLSVLKLFSGDILISSANLSFNNTEYRVIRDEILNLGPLGGIYSCLKLIKNTVAIVLPCDLPLISEEIVDSLIRNSEGYDITVALNNENLPEPLIGIYASSLIPFVEKMIASNQYKMQELFSIAKTNFVKIPGTSSDTFRNINSPGEFKSLPPVKNPLL